MIVLIHQQGKKVKEVVRTSGETIEVIATSCAKALLELSKTYPKECIIWCEEQLFPYIDEKKIKEVFHHKGVLASYTTGEAHFIPSAIEYIEDNPFHKINKKVRYPTWLMSTDIGGAYGVLLLHFKELLLQNDSFGYVLNTISKAGMPQGVFCYQVPLLKENHPTIQSQKATITELYRFTRAHYRLQWVFFLGVCLYRYENKTTLLSLFKSLFYKRNTMSISLDAEMIQSDRLINIQKEYDVIIPTMGREKYLFDVLQDFSKQTLLPNNVIIVEQNAIKDSVSALDYIESYTWPFPIAHYFIHQTGACNARNMAIEKTKAPWVFFADDDNRFEADVVQRVFDSLEKYGVEALTTSYLQAHEKQTETTIKQWQAFGAGNSFVKGTLARSTSFDMALEFGYGEDTDYGMQLRQKGAEILYQPEISLLHLKAPVGGFRKPVVFPWKDETIKPKPSPTVMYHKLKNTTTKQLKGYRLVLALKFYKRQSIKNPLRYRSYFRDAWKQSLHWAAILKNNTL
ncbi:glycosyltransferase family 2 protein [Dokdonia ponticola]|uniref:Glycosyltransferase family 2 protein n=1 Tax=Dokdonia ponticola TaxID=2041041 RepID=A0ABV9I2H3_9FLAO